MRYPKSTDHQAQDARGRGRPAVSATAQGSQGRASRELRLPKRAKVILALSFVSVAAATYAILLYGTPPLPVRAGELAPRDFRARSSFERVDVEATQTARELARRRAPLVFRETRAEFWEAARALLSVFEEGEESPAWESIGDASLRENLRALLPLLMRNRKQLEEALAALSQLYVVSPGDWGDNAPRQPEYIVVCDHAGTPQKTVAAWEVVVLSPAAKRFSRAFDEALGRLPQAQRAVVLEALASVLHPTISMDRERTAEWAESAARRQQPVTRSVREGDLILTRGSEVQKDDLAALREDRDRYQRSSEGQLARLQYVIGLAVTLVVLAGAGGVYIGRYRPELLASRLQRFSLALLTLALVAIARAFVLLDVPIVLTPVPLTVMVLCLVYDQRFGFEAAALYGLLVALAQGAANTDFVVLTLGGMTAALLTGNVRTRTTLIKAGVVAGCAQWAALWGLGLLGQGYAVALPLKVWESPLFVDSLCALGNGVMGGFLVSGLLPGIERLFGITTDIRLLEWSDPNQPLLQRLLVEAPGTYHHSMLVGSLAAEAAESIGANPLLARVSAYFHDIGKLKKPEYFGENLPKDQKNPHEELSPTMSRLIITAHPRDGAEMASRHGLPAEVRNIILESHGSTTTRYFWDIAKQQGARDDELDESDFRYRLPEPRSKEAACVMLADAVESAARSLDPPSAAKIADLVRRIILDRYHDRQLDRSGLSITDLAQIEKALVRGLNAVYHTRIRYPDQQQTEEEAGANRNDKVPNRNR